MEETVTHPVSISVKGSQRTSKGRPNSRQTEDTSYKTIPRLGYPTGNTRWKGKDIVKRRRDDLKGRGRFTLTLKVSLGTKFQTKTLLSSIL